MYIKIKQSIAGFNNFSIDTRHDLGRKQLDFVFQGLQAIALVAIEIT